MGAEKKSKSQISLPDGAISGKMKQVKPMLASLTDEPFNDENWLYEVKHDGYRALSLVRSRDNLIYSRNMNSFNSKFPELLSHLSKLQFEGVLDGEVSVLDKEGISKFQLMQNYLRTKTGRLVYYVFDILFYNGYDLREVPLIERKNFLKSILTETSMIRYSPHFSDGMKVFREAERLSLEGLIAKKASSTYQSGKRTKDWLKIKTGSEHEIVIGGYTSPSGSRVGFGALLAGLREGKKLKFLGKIGTGFSDADLRELHAKFTKIEADKSPFTDIPKKYLKEVTWLKPKLVGQVKYTELTDEGLMRHPVFLGLRNDKKAVEVTGEEYVPAPVSSAGKKASADKSVKPEKSLKEKKNIKVKGVPVTNLNKVFWPTQGYTKGDVINYYKEIAPILLPYLKDRPQSMYRTPDGIKKAGFFQKNVKGKVPGWIKTEVIKSGSSGESIEYLICNNEKTLIYMANLGCIEINPWSSRIKTLEKPDYAVFDLDPLDIGFDKVIEVALEIRRLLDELDVPSYCKTSGSDGFHIYVPLGAQYSYEQSEQFVKLIETYIHAALPAITSLERMPAKRKKKVYLDYLQNGMGKTMSSVYSLRPREGAPVSTPLEWNEVKPGINPVDYNIRSILPRIEKKGDLWSGMFKQKFDMKLVLEKISAWK